MSDPIVIVAAVRTPIGAFQGALASLKATELGATAVRGAVERARLDPERVDQVLMGCVLPAGLGQAPARQAALRGGLSEGAQATTINKMCGSGMQAVILAHDLLCAGSADHVVAGGFESMSNAPYLLPKHRAGARIGHDRAWDSMMLDGLEDAYAAGKPMGAFADEAALAHRVSREAMDRYAANGAAKAQAAVDDGAFATEIVPVTVAARQGPQIVAQDEAPARIDLAKIPGLRPAFGPEGRITPASSSSISDGAAALVLTRASQAWQLGLPVIARIAGHGAHAQAPQHFTTAPAPAIRKALSRAGWSVGDVDLFEVNEAFAVVAMLAQAALDFDPARLNVNGGACALGHPIGASGARIIVTLLAALKARGLKRGVAALCIGGGEATAIALEMA